MIIYFQSSVTLTNPENYVNYFIEHSVFNISKKMGQKIGNNLLVRLESFCLMPNHFHLLVKESVEGGVSHYMQRVLNAYSKYFNTKYKKSGHVFQGPYKAVHVETNSQLLHLSSYIHRNPIDLNGWSRKLHQYPWSSYKDYVDNNRWGNLLDTSIILEQFTNTEKYLDFVATSTAKNYPDQDLLIDL